MVSNTGIVKLSEQNFKQALFFSEDGTSED